MWKPAGGSMSIFNSAPGPRAAATAVTCLLVTGMLVVGDPVEHPAAATGGKVFTSYFRKLTRERKAITVPRRNVTPGPVELLAPSDLFIAVKTTWRYHGQRLELLLDTWISRNIQQVSGWRGFKRVSGSWRPASGKFKRKRLQCRIHHFDGEQLRWKNCRSKPLNVKCSCIVFKQFRNSPTESVCIGAHPNHKPSN